VSPSGYGTCFGSKESEVRVLSPRLGGIMKENDKLPIIISTIATIIFIAFILIISRPTEVSELQGGDIEHAIQTEQYR
jgi:hypothetical protein